jgi:pyruvate dehydrogenase E1 component beta subunit
MPATARDARDLLIASVLCDDPVLFIDDRWLYGVEDELPPVTARDLRREGPQKVREGDRLTLVGAGYSAWLCAEAARTLADEGISCEVIDVRVLNPLDARPIVASVRKTGRLLAVDGDWLTCGFAAEIVARAAESLPPSVWRTAPRRLTLPDAPAPTSGPLEKIYYPSVADVATAARAVAGARGGAWE